MLVFLCPVRAVFENLSQKNPGCVARRVQKQIQRALYATRARLDGRTSADATHDVSETRLDCGGNTSHQNSPSSSKTRPISFLDSLSMDFHSGDLRVRAIEHRVSFIRSAASAVCKYIYSVVLCVSVCVCVCFRVCSCVPVCRSGRNSRVAEASLPLPEPPGVPQPNHVQLLRLEREVDLLSTCVGNNMS